MNRQWSVLFICTGNSCRSQMAEAILRHLGGDRFVALSGGSRPAGFVHPLALATLDSMNIPTEGLESKHLSDHQYSAIDVSITLCDNASAECPRWIDATTHVHWGLPDPVFYQGNDDEKLAFSRQIAQRILARIEKLIQLSDDVLASKVALVAQLNQFSKDG